MEYSHDVSYVCDRMKTCVHEVSEQSSESSVVTWCQKWNPEATRAGVTRSFPQRRKSTRIDHTALTSVSQSVRYTTSV